MQSGMCSPANACELSCKYRQDKFLWTRQSRRMRVLAQEDAYLLTKEEDFEVFLLMGEADST